MNGYIPIIYMLEGGIQNGARKCPIEEEHLTILIYVVRNKNVNLSEVISSFLNTDIHHINVL